MQKKIIALAIAAAFAAPVAMAETANVNVYGSIDGGFRSDTAAGATKNVMGSGTYNSNRWGIKGSEDLGDGMKVFFGLESALNVGNGAAGAADTVTSTGTTTGVAGSTVTSTGTGSNILFDRNATLGLSSGAHAVELGRQYSVSWKIIGNYDPMGYKFLAQTGATTTLPTALRYDNAVDYTGTFGDVKVMAEHTIPTTGDDSTSTSTVGAAYASGAVNVGGAYSKTKVNTTANDTAYYTVGAGYNFGDGKVSIGLTNNTVAGATDTVTKNQFVGVSYNLSSKIGVSAAYYKNIVTTTADVTTTRMIVAATYALSKRTNLYADLDKKSIDNGGTTDSSGASVGIATTF